MMSGSLLPQIGMSSDRTLSMNFFSNVVRSNRRRDANVAAEASSEPVSRAPADPGGALMGHELLLARNRSSQQFEDASQDP